MGVKWIGLSDLNRPGTYAWKNNDSFTFDNWDKNKPDSAQGRCIGMNANGFWANYDCNSKFTSICMARNNLFTTPTTPSTPAAIKCPNGWTDSDNKCHKVFNPKDLKDKKIGSMLNHTVNH